MPPKDVRATLLAILEEQAQPNAYVLDETKILESARERLEATDIETHHALLDAWHDLYRMGLITWGGNAQTPPDRTKSGGAIHWSLPWIHVTALGKRTLEHVSRDPANPQGYLAHVATVIAPASVAYSYIEEGVRTYAACCDKATAVLVGAAAESLVLELRDELVPQMKIHRRLTNKVEDWRVKTVLEGIEAEMRAVKKHVPRGLYERFESFWNPLSGHLRLVRNDVGHPKSIVPVTRETVHGALLVFPEQARLAVDLGSWVKASYAPP